MEKFLSKLKNSFDHKKLVQTFEQKLAFGKKNIELYISGREKLEF
jgi:hypothetical protein